MLPTATQPIRMCDWDAGWNSTLQLAHYNDFAVSAITGASAMCKLNCVQYVSRRRGEFKETSAQVAWLLLALKRGFLAGFFKAHS